MKLREDEHLLLKWLSEYGPLPLELVEELLFNVPKGVTKRIIKRLISRGYIAEREDRYLALDYKEPPDDRRIAALWVMTQYIQEINPKDHSAGRDHAQVYFVKDGYGYDIVVVKEDESVYLGLLQVIENKKYIIVAREPGDIDTDYLPDCPCIIATVEYCGSNVPIVSFYGG